MKMKKFMKKIVPILASGVIASTMVVSFMPLCMTTVYADSEEVIIGNFKYQLNPTDKTATLTGCNFSYDNTDITEINISTVEHEGVTYTVTAVGEWAVSDSYVPLGEEAEYYEHITSVSLPNVTTIGDHAFHFCFGMTSLNLPKVKQIGVSSFGYCEALSSISLPEVISIAESGFAYNAALTNIDMPKVVTVGNNAFKDCSLLETLDLPEVTSIGEEAFSGCTSLTSATLPKVTSLSGGVFNMCMSLETISMPEVIDIGEAAFGACFNLTEVSFPKLKNLGDVAFDSCSGITSISMPSLLTIQDYSLMGIEEASLTIPDTWPEADRPIWDSDEVKFLWKEGYFTEVNYVHVHNFTYSVKSNKIIATCTNTASECPLKNHKADLIANVPNYKGKDITVFDIFSDEALEEFNDITTLSISASDIKIYDKDDTAKSTPLDKISKAGEYTVVITIASIPVECKITIKAPSAPQPQQGAGSSIVNAPGADGVYDHIQNKYVGGANLDINFKLYLSASDFVTNKVTETVDNVIKYDKTLQEQSDYDRYSSNMFGFAVTHMSKLTFMQRILLALFL